MGVAELASRTLTGEPRFRRYSVRDFLLSATPLGTGHGDECDPILSGIAGLLWIASAACAAAQTSNTSAHCRRARASPTPASAVTGPPKDITAQLFPKPRLTTATHSSSSCVAKYMATPPDSTRSWTPKTTGRSCGAGAGSACSGEIFNRVEFEIEREFGDDEDPWRDV